MGLLDKVLSKPPGASKAPGSASHSSEAPTSVSSMISSPAREVPAAPEAGQSVSPEPGPEYSIPDHLLPFPQKLIRQVTAAFSKGTSKGKTPKAAKTEKPVGTAVKSPQVKAGIKGKRILAIDIGTSSIKIVELIKYGHNYAIVGLESRSIPPAMRKNPDTLAVIHSKLLREMLPPPRLKGADVHLLISNKSAQARTVSLPGGAAKELVNAIKFQIKKDLPFPLDVCEINHRGFDPKIPGKQDVEILAIDRRTLESSLKILEGIDFLPVVITAPSAASRNLVKDYTGIEAGTGAVVVVDIGASHTTITIVEESHVVLSRTVNTGGDDFTAALTGITLGPSGEELTEAQAEKYKIDMGLPSERGDKALKAAIQTRPIAERISAEINRSLEVYRRARSGGEIKKLIMAGGGSLMKRLPEFISENTGVDFVLGMPTSRLTLAGGASELLEAQSTECGPVFLPALAVALDDGRELNMLPKSIQSSLKLRKAQGVIAPAVLGLVVLLVFTYSLALRSKGNLESEMKQITEQLKDLDASRARFIESTARCNDLVEQLRARQADFDSIRMGEPELPRYLKAFSNLTPENVYLDRLSTKYLSETDEETKQEEKKEEEQATLSMETIMSSFTKSFGDPLSAANFQQAKAPPVKRPIYGRVIEIEGVVYPQGTLTDVQLVDYVFNLENSGHFRDVAVDSMSTTDDGRVKFRLLCGL